MNNEIQNLNTWSDEYHKGVRYGLRGKVIEERESKYQRITIFDSERYGRALLLDGCWMTAEKQEKYYHECLVHPALSTAENIRNILIIGGGDGGTAKQCLKYDEVERIDIVEIDEKVIELSQKYLPKIGGLAWQDPKVIINITDGVSWVKNSKAESYDVIIVDGSDPKGPAKGLFNNDFYSECRRILRKKGIFAIQSESPEAFRKTHIEIVKSLRKIFVFADPLYGSVPMYPSGLWSWTFATIQKPFYKDPIPNKSTRTIPSCEIWSPRWQSGAFDTMPAYIERELK